MTMDRVLSWAIKQVQQTEQASDIILKDELFQSFQVENPDVRRDTFFLYLVDWWENPHLTL